MASTLRLIRKQHEASNIWSFVFEPSQSLTWTAGQFIRVGLPHANPDSEGTQRSFTIASAPYERHIQISTRITTSSFKQALSSLAPGGTLNLLDPPAGDFIWPAGRPFVFVAQGIGITPFYSMVKQRLHEQQPTDATLLYTNLTSDIPFQAELERWSKHHAELKIAHHQRPFTAADIARLAPHYREANIYVSGPGPLIELLLPPYNLPINQLKQDTFPNYDVSAY